MHNVTTKFTLSLGSIKAPGDVSVGHASLTIEFTAPASFVAERQDKMLKTFAPFITKLQESL